MNMLKPWHTAEARVGRVVVAVEDDFGENPPDKPSHTLSPHQLEQLQNLQSSAADILTSKPGCTNLLVVSIDTGDAIPFQSSPYRLPAHLMEPVKVALDGLLTAGIVEPSSGPWSSPMIPVKKKDGSIRICIDFRRLNSITIPDPYCDASRVDAVIDSLCNASFLSKFDLVKGFHQVPVKASDKPKTAFIAPWGKYH